MSTTFINVTISTLSLDVTEKPPIISDSLRSVFTTIVYGFICQAVVIFGCITNTINMVVFYKLGFKDTINISLLGLAFSDFGGCITLIWANITKLSWFQEMELPFDPQEINYITSIRPHITFAKITTLITAFIVVERCLCVTSPLKVKTILTSRVVTGVVTSSYFIVICCDIPTYYSHRHALKFYEKLNKSLIGLVFTKDRHEIDLVLGTTQAIIFGILPFIVICVCTAIFSASLKKKAVWREKATTGTTASELSMKETKITKMVVSISALFITCFFPNFILNMWVMADPNMSITGKQWNLVQTLGSVVITLEVINSALNVFIYYRNSSNYRDMFDQMFKRDEKTC